jgi:hypothetical protein
MVLAVLFLGERFHLYHVLGIAAAAAGIFIASLQSETRQQALLRKVPQRARAGRASASATHDRVFRKDRADPLEHLLGRGLRQSSAISRRERRSARPVAAVKKVGSADLVLAYWLRRVSEKRYPMP